MCGAVGEVAQLMLYPLDTLAVRLLVSGLLNQWRERHIEVLCLGTTLTSTATL